MKTIRKIIQIDEALCDGCGNCVTGCAEGALAVVDGKARVMADKFCDGLGACIGDCPTGALQIVEREADEFDKSAVEAHLAALKKRPPETKPAGCPSAKIQMLTPRTSGPSPMQPVSRSAEQLSALSHWPVQIRLVPPQAPFLKDARLLVAADCVPVAFPTFHRDFLEGKAVMMGCPKFDEKEMYIDKFAQIVTVSGIRDITCLIMEVPCCAALPTIIRKGMAQAGKTVPMEVVVIGTQGQILDAKNPVSHRIA